MDKSGNRKQILSGELDSETPGPVWSFTTLSTVQNQPPDQPYDPEPENNDNDVAPNNSINFSWNCNDPDQDPLTYDFYLGMADGTLDLLAHGLTSPEYHYFREGQPLFDDTRYQWKIVAKDDHGNETEGDLWEFTTTGSGGNQPPNQPYNPDPPDQATEVTIHQPEVSWQCSDPESDQLTYDTYFGIDTLEQWGYDLEWTNFTFGGEDLLENTTYSWAIIAKDDHYNETAGPIWSFTTGDGGGGGDNTAVEYDGESGFGMIENTGPYFEMFGNNGGYWTIETIFKLESFAQQPDISTIFFAGLVGRESIVLFVTPDDAQGTPEVPTFKMASADGNSHTIMPGAGNEITLGEWTHVAAVSHAGIFSFYINGELISTDTTGLSGEINLTGSPFSIGARVIDQSNYFDGAIDEVRIWSTALTENQIQDRYRQQLTGDETDLEALWQFNEGNGGQFGDSSPTDNGGIIEGQYEWIDADWEQ